MRLAHLTFYVIAVIFPMACVVEDTTHPSDRVATNTSGTSTQTTTVKPGGGTSTTNPTNTSTGSTDTPTASVDMGSSEGPDMSEPMDQGEEILQIQSVTVESVSESEAQIFWTMSDVGQGYIRYGKDESYGLETKRELSFEYSAHRQTIQDLEPETTYHFQVVSTDAQGVEVKSTDQTFTTSKALDKGNWPPVSAQVYVPAKNLKYPTYLVQYKTSIPGVEEVRITDNVEKFTGIRHQYSRRQVWNRDETVMVLSTEFLDAGNYIPFGRVRVGDRNWSNTNRELLYGISNSNNFVRQNVFTDQVEILHTFEGYSECTIGGREGSLTLDDKLVAISCDRGKDTYLFSYNIKEDKVLATLKMREDYNWASFSPSGAYIIVENNASTTSDNEQVLRYTPQLTNPFLLAKNTEHSDLGFDNNGDEVFVMIAWDYVTYIRLKDGAWVRLGISDRDKRAGNGHVSCRNFDRPGRCYITSKRGFIGSAEIGIADPKPIGTSEIGTPLYQGLSNWETWGHHRSKGLHYNSSPKASVSWSGRHVVFSTDWEGTQNSNSMIFEVNRP